MPFGLRNTCVEAVSLGLVEARMGQSALSYGTNGRAQQAPPGILLPPPRQPLNANAQHPSATHAALLPPPPPILPPQLSPDFFARPPPAPDRLPETLEAESNVSRGAARTTIEEAAPRRSNRFIEGSGSLLAQQLARQLNADIVRSELKVKNTFIDGGLSRSPSLERLLRESRQVRSCPGSALPTPKGKYAGTKLGLMDAETIFSSRASTVDTLESPVSWAEDSPEDCMHVAGLQSTPSIQAAAWRNQSGNVLLCGEHGRETTVRQARDQTANCVHLQLEHALAADSPKQSRKARVLQLEHVLTFGEDDLGAIVGDDSIVTNAAVKCDADSSLLARAETFSKPPHLGSAELPSVGSLGHHLRRCRPCAFVLRMGCSNGIRCNFCHLCNAGEKKRRRKEKRALMGAARRLAEESGTKI